jgi:F0F1-type ATP synthase membrane subunit a
MMAGHTLFKIVSGFGWIMFGTAFWFAGFFPIILLFGFTGLELGVAALQAYVFTVLTCIYLNDSIHLH